MSFFLLVQVFLVVSIPIGNERFRCPEVLCKYSVWIGGSILSSLFFYYYFYFLVKHLVHTNVFIFLQMAISEQVYNEPCSLRGGFGSAARAGISVALFLLFLSSFSLCALLTLAAHERSCHLSVSCRAAARLQAKAHQKSYILVWGPWQRQSDWRLCVYLPSLSCCVWYSLLFCIFAP